MSSVGLLVRFRREPAHRSFRRRASRTLDVAGPGSRPAATVPPVGSAFPARSAVRPCTFCDTRQTASGSSP